MSNRYAAPKTPVSASDEPVPNAVRAAMALVFLLVLVECYHQVAGWSEVQDGEQSVLSWAGDWLWTGLLGLIGFMLARGRNWGRWLLVAYTIYQLYAFADAMLFLSALGAMANEMVSATSRLMVKVGPLLAVGATILVFGPGRGWFAR